jgi:hypothetical protein
MEALRNAGVNVAWFWLDPVRKPREKIYRRRCNEGLYGFRPKQAWYRPERPAVEFQDKSLRPGVVPLSSVPSPALFIAVKQPPFFKYPEYKLPKSFKIRKPPWE